MTDLIYRIIGAADRFDQTGYQGRPTKLLLGKQEVEGFKSWIESQQMVKMTEVGGHTRARFQGMDIYPVDDETFFGVA